MTETLTKAFFGCDARAQRQGAAQQRPLSADQVVRRRDRARAGPPYPNPVSPRRAKPGAGGRLDAASLSAGAAAPPNPPHPTLSRQPAAHPGAPKPAPPQAEGAAVPPAPAPTPIPAPAQAARAANSQPAAASKFWAALGFPTTGQAHVAAGGVSAGGHTEAWQAGTAPLGQAHPASESAQAVAGGVGADGSMGAWQAGAAAVGQAHPNADPAHAAAPSAGAAGHAAGDQADLNAYPNPNPHPGLGGIPGAVLAQQQQQVVAAAPQAAEQQLILLARRLQQARTCPLCMESYAMCRYGSAPRRVRAVGVRTCALFCARRAHGVCLTGSQEAAKSSKIQSLSHATVGAAASFTNSWKLHERRCLQGIEWSERQVHLANPCTAAASLASTTWLPAWWYWTISHTVRINQSQFFDTSMPPVEIQRSPPRTCKTWDP